MRVEVVDASAIAAILFDEPEAEAILAKIDGADLVAPHLLAFELASVCQKKVRRHPERRDALLAAYAMHRSFPLTEVAVDCGEALALAMKTGLTAYDASYLWLSRDLGVELVTLDRQLAVVASKLGVEPPFIIAIDGPAAAGKGTLARRLAAHLGLPYLDTGLLYRAVARRVLDASRDPANPADATAAAHALSASDLSRDDLRGPAADAASSQVAAVPEVRTALLAFQRDFARRDGAVLDGRDIGTVIFPDATVKLFVTASVEERGRRRWLEMQSRRLDISLEHVTADLRERDALDSARVTAPLKPAANAIVIDTTELDADAAFERAFAEVSAKLHT